MQRDEVTTLRFLEHFEVSAPYLQKLGWNVVGHLLCYFVWYILEYTLIHILRTTPDIYFLLLSRSWLSSQGKVG